MMGRDIVTPCNCPLEGNQEQRKLPQEVETAEHDESRSVLQYRDISFGSSLTTCQACSCAKSHPQEMYCRAQFVIRAKILSQEFLTEDNKTLAFNLRVQKIFKGETQLNQTDAIQRHGSKKRSLIARAYTASDGARCGVTLFSNTVYLLSGRVWKRKIRLNMCDWIQPWSDVTSRQRMGIRRFYGSNCDCQVSPCYEEHCEELKGCEQESGFRSGDCEWDHSYCVKNADKSACAWRKTDEFTKCNLSKVKIESELS
ncbi:metalloproteinase inhibitor 3-like [Montipora foliosa]|uniref:metalloproteinase inhibitor 3-like n=1 Tax=Montipora foliosa TaxID=591990 RepID=UPI0035F0FC80